MRAVISAATLIAAAVFVPVALATEPPLCQPNPLTHAHPSWVSIPATAVAVPTTPPASAVNPLMVGAAAGVAPSAAPVTDVRRCADWERAVGVCGM